MGALWRRFRQTTLDRGVADPCFRPSSYFTAIPATTTLSPGLFTTALGAPGKPTRVRKLPGVLFNVNIIFSSVAGTQFAVWGLGPAPSNPDYDDDDDEDDNDDDDDDNDEPPVLKGQGA